MAKVATEMVEQVGIDEDKLLDLLIRNASAELCCWTREGQGPVRLPFLINGLRPDSRSYLA